MAPQSPEPRTPNAPLLLRLAPAVLGAVQRTVGGLQQAFHGGVAAGVEPVPLGRILREGFLVGVTNPKSIVLFTAILPQFVDPHGSAPQLQLVVLPGWPR